MRIELAPVHPDDKADVDRKTVRAFTRKLTRWGPFGPRILQLLDDTNAVTRLECAHIAASCGYPTVARKLEFWSTSEGM